MISTVNSTAAAAPPPPPKSDETLSEEQELIITQTLASYDAENLSEQDASDIVLTLTELGIEPGPSLEKIMDELGFDAKSIGETAKQVIENDSFSTLSIQPQSSLEISEVSEFVQEQLNAAIQDSGTITDEQQQVIYEQTIEKFGMDQGDAIINTIA